MNLGQQVRVRATGRQGVVTEKVGGGRSRVGFYPLVGTKPVDERNIERDNAGEVFTDDELASL